MLGNPPSAVERPPGSGVPLPEPNTDDAPTVITTGAVSRTPNPQLTTTPPPVAQNGPPGDPQSVAGRRLGHFELIEAVGSGGMAAVLKARDLELGRVVALKILPPEAARDPENVTRFKQEGRAAARLDHENIARAYYCGEDQGLHFIAFEFVEGINLRQMIERRGTVPAAECVGYMIQIAAGLNHAAGRGVVHRDIKPSNVIITPDGRAKIVDMGLARQLDIVPVNGGVTQSGVTLGTFDYISPEQALDPRRADVRSDIYSLGCAFYHALAGRPPVPEGTAAKKLHAHQHIDPLDPREINPDIPDELVSVLARMMAKDPAQRYQTPAELIAHLKWVALRLKIPDALGHDSTVRALHAESAAPGAPPRLRLGWVLAAAAVAVAVAAFALTGDPGTGAGNPAPPWAGDAKNGKNPKTPDPFGGTVAGGSGGTATAPDDGVVGTAQQLAAKLADPQTKRVQLAAGRTIDLTTLDTAVVFSGREIELVGKVFPPTVVRVNAATADPADEPRPGSLTFKKPESVTVRGVRFEVVPSAGDRPRWLEAGLLIADAGHVTLSDCVFGLPAGAPPALVGAVRVVRSVGEEPAARAQVRAERCVFARGEFAVWVPAEADLVVSDCGFGPHSSAVRVGDETFTPAAAGAIAARDAKVQLERSSFLLDSTSAVIAEPLGAVSVPDGVHVSAGHCVFAALGAAASALPIFPELTPDRRPVVVRARDRSSEVRFEGLTKQKNVYYRVEAFASKNRYLSFPQCREAKIPVDDAGAATLAQRPWAEANPTAVLAGADPWRAFGLRLTEPAVFTPEYSQVKVVGAQFYNTLGLPGVPPWRAYPELVGNFPPPPKPPANGGPRTLVWHPDVDLELPLPPNTHYNLAFLLTQARPGDTVLIRHDGLLPIDKTIDLERTRGTGSEFRVTFKPDRGYTPILTAPGPEKPDQLLDQPLFRLMNGEVAFEGVQFLLRPARVKDGQTVSAVAIVRGKVCSFTDCVFTLAEEEPSKAAAVLVANPANPPVMAMDVANWPVPDIRFERCVIRGKGRGVLVDASRPARVELDQSMTALDGPLFYAKPGGKVPPAVRSLLRLNRVTAFAGGPVVELHGAPAGEMRMSGLVPLDVQADRCLFAAVPGAGKPLVELDGIDPTEKVVEWQVQTANRYAYPNSERTVPVMVIRPGTEGSTPKELNWDQWIAFAGEPPAAGNPVGTVDFENAPANLKALAALTPADAAVNKIDFPDPAAKPADAGVTEKLPTPTTPEP
jgi:hypothetical protein